MKKWMTWLLTVLLLVSLFAGCGKEEPSLQESVQQKTEETAPKQPDAEKPEEKEEQEEEPEQPEAPAEEVGGELYDAGNVTVLVPEGWKGFPDLDVFAEEEGAMDPDILNVSKGGQSDVDLFTKPYVRITYFGPDIQMGKPDASWYENVEDIDSFTTGDHQWYGFYCESLGAPLAILWCEEGDIQYQATMSLGSGDEAISHEDADVQAILASVVPSDGTAASGAAMESEPDGADSFWNGQWYGWWCIRYSSGDYETFEDIAWDAYAVIDDYGDGTGYITLWDSETTKDLPLVRGYVNFDEYGVMTSDYCTFYDSGEWLPDVVAVEPMDFSDWYVDPESSSVSHFENMIEIEGFYEDPTNGDNYFTYYIYLRPWGTDWEDVRNGDTEDCIYSDMMPVLYNEWYAPLMDQGVEELPDNIEDGFALIGNIAETDGDWNGVEGELPLDQLKEALEWAKHVRDYETTYEDTVDAVGVPGAYVDEFESNGKLFRRYRWSADEDNYMTITFEVHADGAETWNVTTWEGLK